MKYRTGSLLTGLLCSLLLSGCFIFTDGATRLANDLRDNAFILRHSDRQTLEIEHRPSRFPDGIDGSYTVLLQCSTETPRRGTLCVEETKEVKGRYYGTTYHLNYVRVPKDISVTKAAGEPVYLLLRKVGDVIEVESVR